MNNLSSNPFAGKQVNSTQMSNNQITQQLMQLLKQVKQAGNPQQVINNLMQRNPQFAQMMQGIQNPQQAVIQMAQQRGIDINSIMKNL